jgi:hypothetical protein
VRRTILILATMVVVLVVAGGVALAAIPSYCSDLGPDWSCNCPGETVCYGTNIPEGEYIWGTDSSETIYGLNGGDFIHAYGGNDTVVGGAGADHLDGGEGYDVCDVDADDINNYRCERLR